MTATARLLITVPAVIGIFVPQQGTTVAQASRSAEAGGHRNGAAWKNVPVTLEN